jgi:lysophospholipase L1-like esterase
VSRIKGRENRFNAVNREESRRAGARYLDITAQSREACRDPTLLAADGLHPSGKMYAAWAEAALALAAAALAGQSP